MTESSVQPCIYPLPGQKVMVPLEDAVLIRKVHRILNAGKNVEIRQDNRGKPKVLRVSKEIEQ